MHINGDFSQNRYYCFVSVCFSCIQGDMYRMEVNSENYNSISSPNQHDRMSKPYLKANDCSIC